MKIRDSITQTIIPGMLSSICFIVPIFFLPFTLDVYDFNKYILLVCAIIATIFLSLIALHKTTVLKINIPYFTKPVIAFLVANLLTVIIGSPNQGESLLFQYGAGGIIVLTIWFLILTNYLKLQQIESISAGFIFSGVILSMFTLLQFLGLNINKKWSPIGSLVSLILFLSAIAPLVVVQLKTAISDFRKHKKEKNKYSLALYGISSIIIVITFATTFTKLFTDSQPVLLSHLASWEIAANGFKSLPRAILGVGQGNFQFAFTTGKPKEFNNTEFWNTRFSSPSNYFFQLVIETGLLGLITYIFIIIGIIKQRKLYKSGRMYIGILSSLGIIFIEQIFFPSDFLQLFLLYTLLALLALKLTGKTRSINSHIAKIILRITGVFAIIFLTLLVFRVYRAEYYIKKSLTAFNENNIQKVYAYQRVGIASNPYIDKYHVIYSQTNLALATGLSKSAQAGENKENITFFLKQSIAEAKEAVLANPTNSKNWENSTFIYGELISQIEESEKYFIESYTKTKQLDPLNPAIRLQGARIYKDSGNTEEAIQELSEAIQLKPDYVEAVITLALVFKENNNNQSAIEMLELASKMVPNGSEQQKNIRAEIDQLKQKPL
jgi:tetratricopeptide (TPR) repeat protein